MPLMILGFVEKYFICRKCVALYKDIFVRECFFFFFVISVLKVKRELCLLPYHCVYKQTKVALCYI